VTEFLTAEDTSPTEIHRHLRSVYGDDAIDVGSVRCWVHHFNSSRWNVGDRPCSGRTATATITETKDKVDVLILSDCCITSELWAATGIGKLVVMAIIRELGNRKVCARWVPKMFNV
jgi:hypothetical protein